MGQSCIGSRGGFFILAAVHAICFKRGQGVYSWLLLLVISNITACYHQFLQTGPLKVYLIEYNDNICSILAVAPFRFAAWSGGSLFSQQQEPHEEKQQGLHEGWDPLDTQWWSSWRRMTQCFHWEPIKKPFFFLTMNDEVSCVPKLQ